MSYNGNTINAPINLQQDVYKCLGLAAQNGAFSVAYACENSHGKINKWAKYKPERHNSFVPITLTMRKGNNFGLAPSMTYTTKTAFINAVKNGTFSGGWVYNAPTSTNYKRLSDFDGYNHNATSPFGVLNPYTGFLPADNTISLVIPAEEPITDTDGGDSGIIGIKDMQNVNDNYSNWYFGILLYNSSRNLMATATNPFSQLDNWEVNFGYVAPSNAGTYKGVPFLSSKPFTISGGEPSNYKIVGIGQSGVKVELKTMSAVYVPWATCWYIDATSSKIQYEVTITNTGGSSVTLTNVVLQIATSVSGANSTTLKSFGSVTVAAGSVWRSSGQATLSSRSYQFCQMAYNGSASSGWVNFEELESPEVPAP